MLDVKFGRGAFMQAREDARNLAETMVGIGHAHGVETVALLTNMDTPLGKEVGNASEIRESIAVLRGEGPDDLWEITLALGVEMLIVSGVTGDRDDAMQRLNKAVDSGDAMDLFLRVVEAQGGDPAAVEDPTKLPTAPRSHDVGAPTDGVVMACDARRVGVAAMRLGAGRERKEDTIDPGVGVTLLARPGDEVRSGQPLARLAYRHTARLEEALRVLTDAWSIGAGPYEPVPLVAERIAG